MQLSLFSKDFTTYPRRWHCSASVQVCTSVTDDDHCDPAWSRAVRTGICATPAKRSEGLVFSGSFYAIYASLIVPILVNETYSHVQITIMNVLKYFTMLRFTVVVIFWSTSEVVMQFPIEAVVQLTSEYYCYNKMLCFRVGNDTSSEALLWWLLLKIITWTYPIFCSAGSSPPKMTGYVASKLSTNSQGMFWICRRTYMPGRKPSYCARLSSSILSNSFLLSC